MGLIDDVEEALVVERIGEGVLELRGDGLGRQGGEGDPWRVVQVEPDPVGPVDGAVTQDGGGIQ